MPGRHTLRAVTALLLVLIAFDLAAIHTCALEPCSPPGSAHTTVTSPGDPGDGCHPHAALHPDHCFCHSLSMGAGSPPLVAPFHWAGAVPDIQPGHLLQASAALYHPPQLPA